MSDRQVYFPPTIAAFPPFAVSFPLQKTVQPTKLWTEISPFEVMVEFSQKFAVIFPYASTVELTIPSLTLKFPFAET